MASVLVVPLRDLLAGTGAEFAAALKGCMVAAGLNPTTVARRTGIGRSQVYNLTEEPSVPRDFDQVQRLLRVCRLHPELAKVLFLQWQALRRPGSGVVPLSPSPLHPATGGDRTVMSPSPEPTQHQRIVAITRPFGLTVVEEAARQTPTERDLTQAATNLLDLEGALASAQVQLRREVDALAKTVLEPDSNASGSVASAGAAFASFISVASQLGAAQREVELTGDAYVRAAGRKKSDR